MIEDLNSDFERGQYLQNLLISEATGGCGDAQDYQLLRRYFVDLAVIKDLLPTFVRTNRDLPQFWQFIKSKFNHYAERRDFIYKEFVPLLDHLEGKTSAPADASISNALRNFDEDSVHSAWSRALDRRKSDPEGAITAARTLLETVCKHILENRGIEYDGSRIELHELYKLTAAELTLAPSQHTQDIFKQILGGCSAVVNGLGTLRNKLGDAHGQGKRPVRPAPRHAELAVNLAGSLALFLVATYETQEKAKA
jgi:hypothetical protein